MSSIDILRDEYPGDEAWKKFVEVFRPAWVELNDRDRYRMMFGDEEIAMVLTASMGDHAFEWFTKPCGALEKKVPSEVLKNMSLGALVLRTLLMRMPR